MTPEQSNALRAVARQCNQEIKDAIKANPKVNRDDISRPIIQAHYKRIEPVYRFVDLLWCIGVLNGVLKERL
ncbi:hypothetical protein N5923_23590 [Erwiniaceae bacterium BAC15a-03b]|uniref:Uncharacterized protein n=1 Tax=Winslowiella arboricola TaxID=2978220 RepID=A0A9J6PYE7_9GAMM|nr:hypothetical protein [Winslowiella arboricola]MCU5775066.1 hypothetical protein [Winslowiella arboricola]MCU5780480.1 hypothetical protein [Winslowiella arboricola]